MPYCIMRVACKKANKLNAMESHNLRLHDVPNADKDKEIVVVKNESPEDNLLKCFREYNQQARYVTGQDKQLRKDANAAIEVLLTFSPEAAGTMDLDAWVKKNVEWLERNFNPANNLAHSDNGNTFVTDNVKQIVLHLDEQVPHIHATIIPIDDKGHLNSRFYVSDRSSLRVLNDSYALNMEEFGLERGQHHHGAKHENIKEFYKLLEQEISKELPAPEMDESMNEYYHRASEVYKTACAHHLREVLDLKHSIENAQALTSLSSVSSGLGIGQDEVETYCRKGMEMIKLEKSLDAYPDKEAAQEIKNAIPDYISWYDRHLNRDMSGNYIGVADFR